MRIDKNIRRFDIDEIIEFANGFDSSASVFPRLIPRKTSIPKVEYNRKGISKHLSHINKFSSSSFKKNIICGLYHRNVIYVIKVRNKG